MISSEERIKILKMIQEGKISAEEGAQLLEALEMQKAGSRGPDQTPGGEFGGGEKGPHWFRVRVTDSETGKSRVNVRLPVSLISAGIKMGARFSPHAEEIDLDQIAQFIQAGEVGQVIDVYDDKDGEHVELFLE
ncbi:MAG: hypothetical protein M1281_20520 [Chloroflexi bacterium]|nr:hypothetical protein [Chloroflexota bacterium]